MIKNKPDAIKFERSRFIDNRIKNIKLPTHKKVWNICKTVLEV